LTDLQLDATIATIISSIAIVASAIFVVVQLRQAARDRYFIITSHLFEICGSRDDGRQGIRRRRYVAFPADR
jgi:hypothetical protein